MACDTYNENFVTIMITDISKLCQILHVVKTGFLRLGHMYR